LASRSEGRHGSVHQVEDHRCDGGGADGGVVELAGPRLKVLEAIDNPRINAALAPLILGRRRAALGRHGTSRLGPA